MRPLILAAAIMMSVFSFAADKNFDKNTDPRMSMKSTVELGQTYRSFGDYFDAMKAMGALNASDVEKIYSFLAKKGIHASNKMTRATISGAGDKIQWGRMSLTYNADQHAYQTNAGYVLRAKANETPDEAFVRVFTAFEGRCKACTAWSSFFEAKAHAESPEILLHSANLLETQSSTAGKYPGANIVEGASAALNYLLDQVLIPATDCGLFATPTAFAGGLASVIKIPQTLIRNFLYDGAITCDGSEYKVENVTMKLYSPIAAAKVAMDTVVRDEMTVNPVSKACLGVVVAGLVNIGSLFAPSEMDCGDNDSKPCFVKASPETLKAAFGDHVPKCTADSAKQVEKVAKKRAADAEKQMNAKIAKLKSFGANGLENVNAPDAHAGGAQ